MSVTSESARALVQEVWPAVVGGVLDERAETMVLAVSRGETGYGGSWANLRASRGLPPIEPEPLRFNMGAIHCPNVGEDCSAGAQRGQNCALWIDSTDGTKQTEYKQCFKAYESALEGFADFCKVLVARRPGVKKVIGSGDCMVVAKAMRESSYFSSKVPIRRYGWFLYSNAFEIETRLRKRPQTQLPACLDCGAGQNQKCIRFDCPGKYYITPKFEPLPADKLPRLPPPVRPEQGIAPSNEGDDGAFGAILLGGLWAFLR